MFRGASKTRCRRVADRAHVPPSTCRYASSLNPTTSVFPTRAVGLPDGRTSYSFTMFQGPGMPDELFESQYESLKREFANIETIFGD